MSDYLSRAQMLDALPKAAGLLGDRGQDADWFRDALIGWGIEPSIPLRARRKALDRIRQDAL